RLRLAGMKVERHAVHAVALPGWGRPVLKNMPEMSAAAPAMHLGAAHKEAPVGLGFDRVLKRRPEARPAGAAVEFGAGVEQRLTTAGAVIDPGAILLVERARAGAFGAMLAQHPVLLRGQPLAPFLVAQRYLQILACPGFGRRAATAQAAQQTF